jgi:hypothetical protein
MHMPEKENLLPQALKALDIKNPVLRYEQQGNAITIWLLAYPEPVTWTQPAPRAKARAGKKARHSTAAAHQPHENLPALKELRRRP